MDSIFNADPTNFEESPLHKITTNHPYMATLGLSVMTTGMLWRWWNQKDGEGKYVNQQYFAEDPSTITDQTFPSLILLGEDTKKGDKAGDGADQFSFHAWRKEGDSGAGQYIKKYADGGHTELWNFVQAGTDESGEPRAYKYSDMDLSEYKDVWLKADALAPDKFTKETEFQVPDGKGKKETVTFKGIDPITNVIALNEFMSTYEFSEIDKTNWSKKDFARLEFLNDIQASKDGYVEWSGYVPFFISTAKGDDDKDTFKCQKSDWVKFRLYLFDANTDTSTNRGIAIANPTFVGPPRDALGRQYQHKDDGRFSAFPEGSRAAEVVGELDLTYNEYTGKWEAGSKQMVGVVTQSIPRAQVLTAERLRSLPPEEMLKNPNDPNSHIIFGSGAALPINMQNANPMQWTPNYAQASETDIDGKFLPRCPKETDEKASVRVFNASAKTLDVNQYVLLNQIDGLWFAIDFPSGIEDFDVTTGFDGKWDFTYCMTNCVHYFKDSGWKSIDAHDIEQAFHRAYYQDDQFNKDWKGGNNYQYNGDWKIGEKIINGAYCQITSFDQMDAQIGGIRGIYDTDPVIADTAAANKNGLGVTNPIDGPNGEIVDGDNNGLNTIGFFGCIFPDGYQAEDIAEFRVTSDYDGESTVPKSGIMNGKWKPTHYFADLNGQDLRYLSETISKDTLPFNNGLARHDFNGVDAFKDEDGAIVPMFNDDDTVLNNLPADIATNAAPSGTWGQPIKSLIALDNMYGGGASSLSVMAKVRSFYEWGQNWLMRVYPDDITGAPTHMKNSFYDLRPRVVNRIMFRPLKAEAYAQYGAKMYDGNPEYRGRQVFQQAISARMTSKVQPVGRTAREREYGALYELAQLYNFGGQKGFSHPVGPHGIFGMMGNIGPLFNSHWGLQYNIDIPGEAPADEFLINTKAYVRDDDASRFHNHVFGDAGKNEWVHGSQYLNSNFQSGPAIGTNPIWRHGENCEAGGIGIIGAVSTCTANSEIIFTTDQRLGCWCAGGLPSLGVRGVPLDASWGKRDGYRDLNTTNLYVKIYHNWPREQTIYDPRFFAVHHFNAGILDELKDENDPHSFKVEFVEEALSQRDPTAGDGSSKSYLYWIAQRKYDCDTLIPTAKALAPEEQPVVNELIPLGIKSRMYGTSVLANALGGGYGNIAHEYVPKGKWLIDLDRRAKLLPYRHHRQTVTIPQIRVVLPEFNDGIHPTGDNAGEEYIYKNGGYAVVLTGDTETVDGKEYLKTVCKPFYNRADPAEPNTFNPFTTPADDVVMIVKNPGDMDATLGKALYQKGDTFLLSDKLGNGFLMKVEAIEETGDYKGKVSVFRVEHGGDDFGNTGFADISKDRPITSATRAAAVYPGGQQINVKAKGFNVQVVRGEVTNLMFRDEKPKIATASEYYRLSIKSNKNDDVAGGSSALGTQGGTQYFGLESGEEEVTAAITEQSTNNKYDMFFHFHNDIGHTFMHPTDWIGTTRPIADEQYIDLTINTK